MFLRAVPPVLLTFLFAGYPQSGVSTDNLAAASVPSAVAAGTQSVELPYRGQSVSNIDRVQVPEGCSPAPGLHFCPTILSTFGGACSVPSHFMEFGKGTGEMTHGGHVDVTYSHCTRVTAAYAITFADGVMTLVTANGDVLMVRYGSGTVSPVNGLVKIDASFTIRGGTGRFEGAGGAGTLHGEAAGTPADLLRGEPITSEMTGTLTYAPGRDGQ